MQEPLGVSEVKAKFAAVCDRAAHGEVIRFTRRRGSKIERFELRQITPGRRELGAWQGKFDDAEMDALSAPMTEQEQADWNI